MRVVTFIMTLANSTGQLTFTLRMRLEDEKRGAPLVFGITSYNQSFFRKSHDEKVTGS